MSDVRKIDWNECTAGYLDEMSNPYHAHRRKVLEVMIPEAIPESAAHMSDLLLKHDAPKDTKALPLPLRENPLNYCFKLKQYGFDEVRQEFVNRHEALPPTRKEQAYPETIGLPEEERWKLLFACSTFVSLSPRY